MKKAIYTITAFLSAAAFTATLIDTIDFIEKYNMTNQARFLSETASRIIALAVLLALLILSLIQSKRPTPRVILIFSGIIFFVSLSAIFSFIMLPSTIVILVGLTSLSVGLLPALYWLIKYGKLVKKSPLQLQRKDGMLLAAGALSSLNAAYGIYSMLNNILLFNNTLFNRILGFAEPIFLFSNVMLVTHSICIAVFCFLRNRRTSVLYRMFFIGTSATSVVTIPANIAGSIIEASKAGHMSFDPINFIADLIPLALALLVLIHAYRMRHDSLTPQEEATLEQAEVIIV